MIWKVGQEPLNFKTLVQLSKDKESRLQLTSYTQNKIEASYERLMKEINEGTAIYGITTGFGKNVISKNKNGKIQHNLAQYLDCALGEPLGEPTSRAVLLARIHVLCQGLSGVSLQLVETLVDLYNHDISPLVPRWGALGASGDLVTMAPLAQLVSGQEVSCWHGGKLVSSTEVLKKYNIKPAALEGRNALAIMNGLSATASHFAQVAFKVEKLFECVIKSITASKFAMGSSGETENQVVNGVPTRHFVSQSQVAIEIYEGLLGCEFAPQPHRQLQDEYSLRCLAQILGPIRECIDHSTDIINQELNSVSDNPIVDPENGIHNGGNFFGGYLAMAADHMALAICKLSELLERQTFHLVSGEKGLPVNLIEQKENEALYHGLKGLHQMASSLQMNLVQKSMPCSVLSRSSESHNQDIVSNAMNAVNRVEDQVEILAAMGAVHSLMAAQAVDLCHHKPNVKIKNWHETVRKNVSLVTEDRSLRADVENLKKEFLKL